MAASESGTGNFQKGLPVGVGVGMAIGAGIGAATGNMGLLAVGLVIGIGLAPTFGAALNKKEQDASGKHDASEEDEK